MSSAVTTTVLAFIPSPDRGVWHLGPIPIRAYALCIIAGIVVAVLWGERRFVARGGEAGTVTDVAVFAVPFGLVGGRLYHVATDWQTYFGPDGDPIGAFKIWQGGLGIWGAVALGAVGAWIGCRRRGVSLPFFADAVAPGIVTAQAIGRLGNWFNQELYGAPTTLPWGLEIYRRVNPETGAPDNLGGVALDRTPIEVVHPTFLYELLWNLVVAGLVVWADRRFKLGHGRAFAVYVAGYTAGRFWIEQMRTDYATRVFGDLRINVVVSAVVFLAAVLYLALVRGPREVLPASARIDGSSSRATDAPDRDEEVVPVGAGASQSSAEMAGLGQGTAVRPRPPRPVLDPTPAETADESDGSTGADDPEGADAQSISLTGPAASSAAAAHPARDPAAGEGPAAEDPEPAAEAEAGHGSEPPSADEVPVGGLSDGVPPGDADPPAESAQEPAPAAEETPDEAMVSGSPDDATPGRTAESPHGSAPDPTRAAESAVEPAQVATSAPEPDRGAETTAVPGPAPESAPEPGQLAESAQEEVAAPGAVGCTDVDTEAAADPDASATPDPAPAAVQDPTTDELADPGDRASGPPHPGR